MCVCVLLLIFYYYFTAPEFHRLRQRAARLFDRDFLLSRFALFYFFETYKSDTQ